MRKSTVRENEGRMNLGFPGFVGKRSAEVRGCTRLSRTILVWD